MLRTAFLPGILILVAVCATYYPSLDNDFHDIDDCIHLDGVLRGRASSPHFRPFHMAWNAFNFHLFGTDPRGYHSLSLIVHWLNALLVFALGRQLFRAGIPALIGALSFAAFYAPNEVVMWMAAACSLLVVFFILLAANFYLLFLRHGRRRDFLLTAIAMLMAMGCKEDCVVLGPVLIALEVHVRGWKSLLTREALLRYGVFLILGLAYLSVAFRPELWAERSDVGQYSAGFGMVPKLFRSLGVLFWPKRITGSSFPSWALGAGVAGVVLVVCCSWRHRVRRGVILLALTVAVSGMMAVLPGPAPIVAKRYVYVSVIGAAILMAVIFESLWLRLGAGEKRIRRWVLAGVFLIWIVVQILAVRSLDRYHFEPAGDRTRTLVEGTRDQILPALATGDDASSAVYFVSPMIWNELDYPPMVSVLAGFPRDRVSYTEVTFDELRRRMAAGGDMSPGEHAVFGQKRGGPIYRLGGAVGIPWERWEGRAEEREWAGKGKTLAVFRFLP